MTRKTLVGTLVLALQILFTAHASAQPAGVKKAAQSVFSLTTFNADGTVHTSTHGVLIGNGGEGVAMWHAFKGADRAVIIDTRGKQYDVDAMTGISENYDLCTFRIKNYAGADGLPLTSTDYVPPTVYIAGYDLKKPDIKSAAPLRTEKFMTSLNYIVFDDDGISGSQLGCPVVNDNGQLLGIVQRPADGGQAFSADARLTRTFELKGFSINDHAFRATGIRTGLPTDEKEASLMLVLAASTVDSIKYERYIDDYIQMFPTATDGYNARATQLVASRRLAEADDVLQTEVRRAAQKDVANSNYAALVYQACVYRVDTTFTKWSLDKAMTLAEEAYKENPQPAYRHQQAQILYAQGNYRQALDMFTELQSTDIGKNGEVYYEAAQCKAMLQAPQEEILALLDTAVSVQGGAAAAPYVLARGRVYDNAGQYRKAFLDYLLYDSLMNYRVLSADFYYTKYKCEMQIRQYQLALYDISHAILLNRTEPTYYAELASLQLRVNKVGDALETCDAGLRLTDSYADLYILKGIGLCETKRTAEGLEALRKAQELGDERADKLIEKYSK